jgi:acid phosphatase
LLRAAPKVDPQHPYDHVVVVVMENHASGQILGSAQAPYLNALAKRGLVLSDSHGETHPSEPNYLALFAGQTFGVTSDACPLRLTGPTLAGELRAAHLGFAGYSEGLPKTGFTGCQSGRYARKHNPWVNFASLPASLNKSFSAFPKSYGSLPTVSIVVPDLGDDMHDGTIQQADSWLRKKLGAYVTWASSHRSLLIVTWDEDNGTSANHIPTFVVGDQVRVGTVARRVNHYTLLRTIEDLYGLPRLGQSRQEKPIALTG